MTSQPATASPEIQLLDLEKRFREVRAVDGVSLEIGTGEFFSLLGPSGCGKTTTLRMIGGFELPTGGTILLRGRDVTNDPPDKRPVNMVFQNYALFPHLDVGDNVAFGLKREGVAKDETTRARPPARRIVDRRATGGAVASRSTSRGRRARAGAAASRPGDGNASDRSAPAHAPARDVEPPPSTRSAPSPPTADPQAGAVRATRRPCGRS